MYPDSKQQLSYESDDTVYFFVHAFDPLNNWSAHAVEIWGKKFPTVEHAFQYRKFTETAPEIAAKILAAPSPWSAMRIGRQHAAQQRLDWREVNVPLMTEIAKAKFIQNEDALECLLATGAKRIVENSPFSNFWGCGADGKGQNQMGKILKQIRDELENSQK
ncbi:MAG TPA: NADAR family protein [Candidatus Saccharimonadales bacterium]|jgi:hypothetical protein